MTALNEFQELGTSEDIYNQCEVIHGVQSPTKHQTGGCVRSISSPCHRIHGHNSCQCIYGPDNDTPRTHTPQRVKSTRLNLRSVTQSPLRSPAASNGPSLLHTACESSRLLENDAIRSEQEKTTDCCSALITRLMPLFRLPSTAAIPCRFAGRGRGAVWALRYMLVGI